MKVSSPVMRAPAAAPAVTQPAPPEPSADWTGHALPTTPTSAADHRRLVGRQTTLRRRSPCHLRLPVLLLLLLLLMWRCHLLRRYCRCQLSVM